LNSSRLIVVLLVLVFLAASCGGGRDPWVGVYSNANSSVVLEIKSGGKGSFALAGEKKDCTYTTDGTKTLTLDCNMGDKITFTKQADGSLMGPPGNMIGALTKKS
jgi:hypothetical protein